MTESNEPRPPEGMQFNAPPGWPPPPPGWVPSGDFQPDPSWPAAPPEWQWWVPARDSAAGFQGSPDVTAVMPMPGGPAPSAPAAAPEPPPGPPTHPGPEFEPGPPPSAPPTFAPAQPPDATAAFASSPPPYAGPDYSTGPHTPQGPPPGSGPTGSSGQQGSWVGRHKLLTAALVVVALLALGGVGTAGAVLLANRGDNKSNAADTSPRPQVSSSLPAESPQPSPSASEDSNSGDHKAACNKAAAPNNKAVDLVKGYTTKSMSNAAIIAAIPPVQADLNRAADSATGVLQMDLQEYATALGGFRTTLMQGRDANTAAAKVLIYSIVLKAECGF